MSSASMYLDPKQGPSVHLDLVNEKIFVKIEMNIQIDADRENVLEPLERIILIQAREAFDTIKNFGLASVLGKLEK